ncbi:glycosyltransferase [Cellulomonas aerilata]|uniref:Glycosyl transferase family 1 n=1 Tax=Cellulomonas aerilata TaxID=515326 RepID=A0A512DF41_9CELL|nr:glycosyltransferase [Cellulomonas aerilata]GEO35052.1 glycosyl transferase family 1 [Cellulomonas aerilata]
MTVPARTVAVWKNEWLPRSETFIKNQTAALSRWTPVRVGWTRVHDGIDRPDIVLLPERLYNTRARRVTRTGAVTRRYARQLRRRGVDLVHAHFGFGAIEVQPIARAAGVPLVATFHGVDVTAYATGDSSWTRLYRQRLQDVFAYSTTLIAVSGHIADRLVALGAPPEKVVVHHIGATVSPPVASTAPDAGVLFLGRLVEKKGVEDLLRAVAALPSHLRGTPVTVVGFGPLEERLRRTADELGVDARFVGAASADEVPGYMRSARVICVPSKTAPDGDTEGLPMTLLEAAAQERPIVATRHAGIPEFVTDGMTGLLSPESCVSALAANLAAVLDDETLSRRLGTGARRRLEQDFDLTTQTALLEDLYDAALG